MNDGLSLILGPVSEADFFSDYWEQTPLHVSRADPGHFATLLSLSMIETLLSSQALFFPSVQLVHQNEPVLMSMYTDDSRRIIPQRLIEHHHQGATVIVMPIRKPIITFDPIPSQRHAKALNAHLSISQTSVLAWQETLSWDLHQMKLINL